MAVTTFAAIDIGSYEVSMKIFEMSKRTGFREINDVRYQLELGRGTYAAGRLEMETVDELCGILDDFKRMMADFGVESWRACATSSLRELENPVIILEQIFQRTGIRVEILSNAEQHFLGYKSIAAIESGFKKAIQKGTAILDIGGGNLQISLFDKDALVLTHPKTPKIKLLHPILHSEAVQSIPDHLRRLHFPRSTRFSDKIKPGQKLHLPLTTDFLRIHNPTTFLNFI